MQQQRADLQVQLDAAFAQAVQQRLHVVREGDDAVQPEDAGRALDGVGAAEQGIELVAVARVLFEFEQQLLDLLDLLGGFLDEGRQRLGDEAEVDVALDDLEVEVAGDLPRWADQALGLAAGGVIGGILVKYTGLMSVFVFGAAMMFLWFITAFSMREPEKRRPASANSAMPICMRRGRPDRCLTVSLSRDTARCG